MALARDNAALVRKIYRAGGWVEVSPVSKGTWTVTARVRPAGSRRWTGLNNLTEVEETLADALDWVVEQAVVR